MLNPIRALPLVATLLAGGLQGAIPTKGQAQAVLAPALSSLRSALGPDMDLAVRSTQVDASGGLHARLQQTYRGVPIWGAEALIHHGKGGQSTTTQDRLVKLPLQMDVAPRVAREKAEGFVLRHLAPAAPLDREPQTELVLYPSVKSAHWAFTTTLENGKPVSRVDAAHSSFGRSAGEGAWALAYHVHTEVSDRKEGPRHTDYIVDARNGEILEIWDSLRRHRAPGDGTAKAGQTASLGPDLPVFNVVQKTGHSQYSGDVTMNVLDDTANSGQFILQDATRTFDLANFQIGTANPATGDYGYTVYNMWGSGFTWPAGQRLKFQNASGVWGDGQGYDFINTFPDYSTVNAETAAVDALHGIELYMDMLGNVFGTNLGNSNAGIAARVHLQTFYTLWNPSIWGVDVGDSPDTIFQDGSEAFFQSVAEPEIIAHELTHGLVSSSAALNGIRETSSVEESYADVMASLAKFYSGGAAGQGAVIPEDDGGHGDGWIFGLQILGKDPFYPVRYMAFPQRDGLSPASWYSGMGNLDGHFGSGVGNRAFYFLSQGAAPYAGPDDAVASSAYVPAGFSGIGNQKAANLWLDTLFQQLPSTADYQVLRVAMLFAAYNRFGPASPEYAAVENAFAAVNVGGAHGQAPRPLVSLLPASTIEANPDPSALFNLSVGLFLVNDPTKAYVAHVANAADPTVTWTAPDGGRISADGTYQAPNLAGFVLRTIATSNADPLEYAVGAGLVVNGDMDDDTEFDAVDAAEMASQLAGLGGTRNHNGSANLLPFDPLNDSDVQTFREAFFQAYSK